MWQRFVLDRGFAPVYYHVFRGGLVGLGLAVAGCGAGVVPLVPRPLPPLERGLAGRWVAGISPTRALRYDVRWTFENQQGTVRGRAAIRFVPPDSLRFDYRAPFGRSGAAVLMGDSVRWAEPEDGVASLLSISPLFWAALGIPRPPPDDVPVFGLVREGERVWRYAVAGDTLTHVAHDGPERLLRMDLRRDGDVVGRIEVTFADTVALASRALMLFPGSASRFTMTVQDIEELTTVDPDIWQKP